MSVLDIAMIGDPVLRERASQVSLSDLESPEVQRLIDDMIDTMRDANGAGIAANQVSVPRSIAVVEVNDNPRYPYKPRIPLTVLVNPVIKPIGDEIVIVNEGCLSVPLRGDVRRFVDINMTYTDRLGNPRETNLRGLTAATMQHECDHLDGILFIDRVDDPSTLATWHEFERHQRPAFVARMSEFVSRIGS